MDYRIHLPLYGSIVHDPKSLAWDLYQSHAAARLRDISLSSVPAAFAPHGMPVSRFQHSVAVGYLAGLVSDQLGFDETERHILLAAALLHDSGSPPFSHVAEIFQAEITGRHHEAEVARVLEDDETVQFALDRRGVDAAAVLETILGARPVTGPLLAGSVDLDNIDNSLHLLHSLTGLDPLPYRPEQLVQAFRLQDGVLSLHTDGLADMLAWAKTRRQVYDVLYAPEPMSATAGLYRALELAFAEGALDAEFFAKSEGPALEHLSACHAGAAYILDTLSTWHHYPEVLKLDGELDAEQVRKIAGDWRTRLTLGNQLARELGLRPEQVALHVGVDKGVRSIDLPWVGDHAQAAATLFGGSSGRARVALYCQGDPSVLAPRARQLLPRLLAEAKPQGDGHSFF